MAWPVGIHRDRDARVAKALGCDLRVNPARSRSVAGDNIRGAASDPADAAVARETAKLVT
jgi:hypothetical protein